MKFEVGGTVTIVGARIVTPGRDLGVACVRVECGKIVAVGTDVYPVSGDEIVEADGLTLLPGFVDIHSHGRGGADFCDATDAAFDTIGRGKLADGVTGFLATGLTRPEEDLAEMFGAETILMSRCGTVELFERTVHLINDFKGYFESYHMPVYENPSPGNKQGGITTLEDKALGCTQKSGSSAVKGVLSYAERVTTPGLNLLSAPGNDLVASTALAASGAQLVLFSTGRGTPFGCPVPTIKISSNTPLAVKKHAWIDFNAGRLLDGMTLDQLGNELMDLVLSVASGEKLARNEENGFREIAIFKQGVTL